MVMATKKERKKHIRQLYLEPREEADVTKSLAKVHPTVHIQSTQERWKTK
jgi:hypothetical protein